VLRSCEIFEIYGDSGAGKTTFAIWLAKQVEAAWIVAPQESPQGLWSELDYQPVVALEPRCVSEAFEMAEVVSGAVQLVILDSLGGLTPDHPDGRTIGLDVAHALSGLNLKAPMLATNQDRHPARPGGSRWKNQAHSCHLVSVRDAPALYSFFQSGPEWLVWWPGDELDIRLLNDQDQIWVPERVKGGEKRGRSWVQRVVDAANR